MFIIRFCFTVVCHFECILLFIYFNICSIFILYAFNKLSKYVYNIYIDLVSIRQIKL